MKTLYDLLGARPEDDAEALKNAFRRAAKANHPDLHAGDPDAPMRFKRIVGAYDILRHAEQRATYDRLLEFEREQLRSASKRYTMRKVVSDAVAVVALAIVMAGGYTLFTRISTISVASRTSVQAVRVVELAVRGPAETAAVQPAEQADAADRDEPHDILARMDIPGVAAVSTGVASEPNTSSVPGIAGGGPAPNAAETKIEVTKTINAFSAPIDPADAKTTADVLKKSYGIEPLDQNNARPAGGRPSSLEKDNGVSSPSDPTISGEKRDMRMSGRPRPAPKRQAMNHASFKQVSLENRNTSACSGSQSCASDVPPLFGLGF
jgi:hypothetical protein